MDDTIMVKTIKDNGIVVVMCAGELDLHISNEFDKALADAVSSGGHVTVDLTSTNFIDSAILQSISRRGKVIFNRGDRIKVLVVSGGHPEYVLKVTGLGVIVDIVSVESKDDSRCA